MYGPRYQRDMQDTCFKRYLPATALALGSVRRYDPKDSGAGPTSEPAKTRERDMQSWQISHI